MILTGPEIKMLAGRTARHPEYDLVIDPFDPGRCGPNSYDVTLADTLLEYVTHVLHCREENPTVATVIPSEGYLLKPGRLYLGSTVERVECRGVVPWIDGRSSIGRLGIHIHATAGRGDDGFRGTFTLEISVVQPVWIHPGIRIGQLTFVKTHGEREPYSGRYQDQEGPTASRMHL